MIKYRTLPLFLIETNNYRLILLIFLTFLSVTIVVAEDVGDQNQKDQYNFFNPTPKNKIREMVTDRPDTTEAPITVDAGHVQYEGSMISGGYNSDIGVQTKSFGALASNLKFGLTNNIDMQFVFTPYEYSSEKSLGAKNRIEGFSDDTQIRVKVNLWGNDGGDTALALMPYIKFPTGTNGLSNDHIEGGLIVPYGLSLPNDFSLGLMLELDAVYIEESDLYKMDVVHTATIGHEIYGDLGGYFEYIGNSTENLDGSYLAEASGGITYSISDDWILDAGGTVGLSKNTDDITYFIGTSFRS